LKKFLFIFLLSISLVFGQNTQAFKLLKFHPISLASGSLNMSEEFFNKKLNKSIIVGLGIRYFNENDIGSYQYGISSSPVNQFNKWQGGSISLEKRIYLPSFSEVEKSFLFSKKNTLGLYFSTGAKVEYNLNSFDNSRVTNKTDPNSGKIVEINIIDQGKNEFWGVLPNLNIGLQFTLFQNLYADIHIGGGIRFLKKNIITSNKNNYDRFYYDSIRIETINQFIVREGVQGNFGFALGFKID
jgi:hypothetical protein